MRTPLSVCVGLCLLPGLLPRLASQSPRDLAGYLPANTPLVVDLYDGARFTESALKLLEPMPKELPAAARVFLLGLPLLTKSQTGMDLRDLLTVLAPGQTAFAMFPAAEPFPVLLSRIEEASEVRRLMRKFKSVPASLDDGILTVTNKPKHLEAVLAFRRSGQPTLLGKAEYRKHRMAQGQGASLRFYGDLAEVRRIRAAIAQRRKQKKGYGDYWSDVDGAARFLFGPVIRTLDKASRVDARLDITATAITIDGRADAEQFADAAQLVAVGSKGRRRPAPPENTLAVVSLDRDLEALLAHPKRWLDEDGVVGVQSAISGIDQLLGTASLLKDLLPAVKMPVDLFITDSTPQDDAEEPRIVLPAFTLVFGVPDEKAKKTVAKLLGRAMSTLVTITSFQRVQDKKTPMTVRRARRGGFHYQFARFSDFEGEGDPPIEQGLSPTLVFSHGYGVLSSTIDGALRMAKSLASGVTRKLVGDQISLRGNVIADFLRRNSGPLVISRVLEEGDTLAAARSFYSIFNGVVSMLDFEAQLQPRAQHTGFSMSLTRRKTTSKRGQSK